MYIMLLLTLSATINLLTNTYFNAKINEAKGEMPSITNLATAAAHNAKIMRLKVKYQILLI